MKRFSYMAAAAMLAAVSVSAQNGNLTAIHGVPGLPAPVEVFANGSSLFSFDYGDQQGPLSLPAGSYALDIRLNGASILSGSAQVTAGDDFTAIAHLDAGGTPQLSIFQNDVTAPTLPASRLIVRHTAQAPGVDVLLSQAGSTVATLSNLTNPNEQRADVSPGVYGVQLNVAGTSQVAFGPANVALEDGYAYAVHAVGDVAGTSFRLIIQRIDLSSRVSVLHGIPGLPAPVDILANGAQLFSFDFGDFRGPLVLNPGAYQLDVSLQGTVVLGTNAMVVAGDDVTVAAHLDANGANTLSVFANDVSALQPNTSVRVTVRHLAQAPAVDVALENGGRRLATIPNLSNGNQAVADIAAGLYEVSLFAAGTNNRVLGPLPWKAIIGQSFTFSAIGSLSGNSFTVDLQSRDLAASVPGQVTATNGGASCSGLIGVSSPSFEFGAPFEVSIRGGVADSASFLNYGDSISQLGNLSLPFDFGPFGAPGCFLNTNLLTTHPLVLDSSGSADITFVVPRELFGRLVPSYFQFISMAPAANSLGMVSSDYLEIR